MTDFVHKLLTDAVKEGYRMIVDGGGDEADYSGFKANLANEAVNNVDEATVIFYTAEGLHRGYAFIVNGLEEDERIADCNGWVSGWTATNIPGASADG